MRERDPFLGILKEAPSDPVLTRAVQHVYYDNSKKHKKHEFFEVLTAKLLYLPGFLAFGV